MQIKESVEEYLDKSDWRVNANANQGYSIGGLILNTAGKVIANYWLNEVYNQEASNAHRSGDLHIHDLDMLSPYCAGWSLRTLLTEGFNGVDGKIEASPPKHISSALGQCLNFLGTLQNEWAGAMAFSGFDTYLAPIIKIENPEYSEIKQCVQEFVYGLNVSTRWGMQSPFSNITFDLGVPDDLKEQYPTVGGKVCNFTYGECQEEADLIAKAFCEIMLIGDAKRRPFSYPIPTYNITKEFNWDSEIADLIFQMAGKYGLPYFQNFLNSSMKPEDVRSMCCRLQLDLRELKMRGNGLFGSAEQTGSVGVVTLNCARIGYLFRNKPFEEVKKHIQKLCDIAKDSLETKRVYLTKRLEEGLYPYTKRYLGTFRNHFSTIGVNGVNEFILNYTNGKEDVVSNPYLATEILSVIREKMKVFQKETENMYNLEATPAEGAMYRFAREDKKRYRDIIQAGTDDAPYYTNSSQLPTSFSNDIFAQLDHQEPLQTLYTGGTVLHLFLGEKIDSDKAKRIVKKVFQNYRVPYITLTPVYSICSKHGYISGKHSICPYCGEETEVYDRVMGYYKPIKSANIGKKQEIEERNRTILN